MAIIIAHVLMDTIFKIQSEIGLDIPNIETIVSNEA